ncbi:hypothetical protein [Bacillus sp. B1-b2]|nr:hypothetical protein [Bacillus sp. B1-b2]
MNNVPDLMVTLIKMQAKNNEKLDQCTQRIKQLEHIIYTQSFVHPPTTP